jgi:exodeoxyribonuclease V gamma subunit
VIGDLQRAVTYSRLAPKQRLAAWVRLLALTASHPERAFRAVTVGRGDEQVMMASIGPLGDDPHSRELTAHEHLGRLVDLYRRGMLEPLPIYCRTSAAYAAARRAGHNAEAKARKAWTSTPDFSKEDRELEHQLVLNGTASFEGVLAAPPRPDEQGDGWADDEPSRFGLLARRMYDGLLTFEKLTSR